MAANGLHCFQGCLEGASALAGCSSEAIQRPCQEWPDSSCPGAYLPEWPLSLHFLLLGESCPHSNRLPCVTCPLLCPSPQSQVGCFLYAFWGRRLPLL